MAKKKVNALETLLQVLKGVLLEAGGQFADEGIDALLHKNKKKIKDAAVPVKDSTPVHPDSGGTCPPGTISDGHGGCIKDPG